MNSGATRPALAPKKKKTDYRDVIMPSNRSLTVRTSTARPDDAFLSWNSENKDIRKASEKQSKCAKKSKQETEWQIRQGLFSSTQQAQLGNKGNTTELMSPIET
jgi:hypothetical protein